MLTIGKSYCRKIVIIGPTPNSHPSVPASDRLRRQLFPGSGNSAGNFFPQRKFRSWDPHKQRRFRKAPGILQGICRDFIQHAPCGIVLLQSRNGQRILFLRPLLCCYHEISEATKKFRWMPSEPACARPWIWHRKTTV